MIQKNSFYYVYSSYLHGATRESIYYIFDYRVSDMILVWEEEHHNLSPETNKYFTKDHYYEKLPCPTCTQINSLLEECRCRI